MKTYIISFYTEGQWGEEYLHDQIAICATTNKSVAEDICRSLNTELSNLKINSQDELTYDAKVCNVYFVKSHLFLHENTDTMFNHSNKIIENCVRAIASDGGYFEYDNTELVNTLEDLYV